MLRSLVGSEMCIRDRYWRPAYIELCIYLNGLKGQRCKYDPNP